MIRRLFTIASVLSLLLCVATTVVWVRSDSIRDTYFADNADRDFTFESNCGVLRLVEHRGLPKSIYPSQRFSRGMPYPIVPDVSSPGEPGIRSELAVPGLSWFISDGGTTTVQVGIPPSLRWQGPGPFIFYPCIKVNVSYWVLVILAAILPGLRLRLWWRQQYARESGCCPTCGYDLRASKDRCPECGAPIPVEQELASTSN